MHDGRSNLFRIMRN